jgi:YegS/Rv2252/BmrU family lipid kinase
MKKAILVYNKNAGRGAVERHVAQIVSVFDDAGYEMLPKALCFGENPMEGSEDVDLVVIAGGDGTINYVVNGIMHKALSPRIGVIPAGTSNDFARHIKMPQNFSECIDKILAGNIQPVDVGLANDKYFVNVCSAGLFTNASQKVDPKLKNAIGHMSYIFAAAEQLFKFRPFQVKIETEKFTFEGKINLFLIFNGSSAGGINKFTNDSSIQDGVLDVLIIKNCKFYEVPTLLAKVLTGKHFDDKNVIYLKEKWVKVTKIKGRCDAPDVDGDDGIDFPLDVKCVENAINMFL